MVIIHDLTHQKFYGVRREAGNLGVTPGHLLRVLRGERKSPRLEKLLKGKVKEVA